MGVCLSKRKKSSSSSSGVCLWVELNEDLCTEILKRLPIKLVCRIRCVCKEWNSLITSSFFISHHLYYFNSIINTNHTTATNKSFFLLHDNDTDTEWSYALDYPQESAEIRVRPVPFRRSLTTMVGVVVGVTQGVVCLSPIVSHSGADSTVVWNPTINKYLEIPHPKTTLDVIGFGYDAVKNDFKVVGTWWSPAQGPQFPMFEVFSTRDWRWTKVDAYQFGPFGSIGGCFINGGSIHWIIKRYVMDVGDDFVWALLTYECGPGEFKMMELPDQWSRKKQVLPIELRVDRGMLYVDVIALDIMEMDTWVMEEYGVASSWNKLLSNFDHVNKVDSSTLHRYDGLWKSSNDYQRCFIQPTMFLMDAATAV